MSGMGKAAMAAWFVGTLTLPTAHLSLPFTFPWIWSAVSNVEDVALVGPVFRSGDETGAERVVSDVVPLFFPRFVVS